MKQLIMIVVLGVAAWFGYHYWQSHAPTPLVASNVPVKTTALGAQIDSVTNVLGASTMNAVAVGGVWLNTLTAGKSGPIVNRVTANLQSQAKELPAQIVSNAQYQYCKNVVTQYESSHKGKQ